jgi:hypothetical protein
MLTLKCKVRGGNVNRSNPSASKVVRHTMDNPLKGRGERKQTVPRQCAVKRKTQEEEENAVGMHG